MPTEHGAAKSLAQMTDLLNANSEPGSIAGVWGAYDLLVSGANEAIRRAGRDEIKVASIDGDQVAFQMLYGEGSPFVATVVGDVLSIGRLGGEAIIKAACGRAAEVPVSTYTQMWTATRNNGIAAGEARWGEGLWDAIQIPKADIEAMYEQNQDVVTRHPDPAAVGHSAMGLGVPGFDLRDPAQAQPDQHKEIERDFGPTG